MRTLITAGIVVAALAFTGCGGSAPQRVKPTSTRAAMIDRSAEIGQSIDSDTDLLSALNAAYPGATVTVSGSRCVQSAGTETYACIVRYLVSGSLTSNPGVSYGHYQLAAHGTCNAAGDCQYQTDSIATASPINP